ncbi:hypothetical protein M404DRAFT_25213 [Pisolithus tinctorius Marx 270]|uniref:DNA-directed RNA polymerase n=1 Tax=Pisolithus tinctorius Marx 270 TaxID=870435 RepID=A0A0C3J8Y5_PISTI|nr:hypothetical protein M404DRAFT_25213 [Pisolithus tinctorius Marx 270]
MSHRVKLMPYSTSHLNPSVRSPYNADFGGDEMNMHIPQSETRAESSQIALNAVQIFHIDRHKPSDLEPAYIVDAVYQLTERLLAVLDDDELGREAQASALLTFCLHVRATLATRRVLEEFHLNCEVSEWVLGGIQAKFNQSLVNPGEMCSTLVAQSIGEPVTQMSLNTFHYACISSKNVMIGAPGSKEIINVATSIKTPLLSVYLESDVAQVASDCNCCSRDLVRPRPYVHWSREWSGSKSDTQEQNSD